MRFGGAVSDEDTRFCLAYYTHSHEAFVISFPNLPCCWQPALNANGCLILVYHVYPAVVPLWKQPGSWSGPLKSGLWLNSSVGLPSAPAMLLPVIKNDPWNSAHCALKHLYCLLCQESVAAVEWVGMKGGSLWKSRASEYSMKDLGMNEMTLSTYYISSELACVPFYNGARKRLKLFLIVCLHYCLLGREH